ncbi:hypothetical protein EXIGLDRAFT_726655 [Exidia glandulosa HHB12029]|uniref:Aminoglycoside phosphotransferase domain-containing protein n=1 Tax=Exidia glandulosa HHB12029 TaxID=1314781 RepID=A0A165DM84_EXIGL|nr:hypothetical protein EXIGLDRAFT_726655 [Exidia glandulosa HHB12029]
MAHRLPSTTNRMLVQTRTQRHSPARPPTLRRRARHSFTVTRSSSFTFQHRVRQLVGRIRSPDQAASAVISRLPAGSFNRIIGITIAPGSDSSEELILRLEGIDVTVQARVLSWISRSTELPVPRVLAYDNTTDNSIAERYILMEKLPGVSLCHAIDDMTDAERLSMADNVAHLLGSIYSVPVPSGIGPLVLDKQGQPCVGLHVDGQDGAQSSDDHGPVPATLLAFLSTRFKEQRQYCQTRWPAGKRRISYYNRLLLAAEQLLSPPFSLGERNVLFHRGFAARNILVHRTDGDWVISGVLDWDYCAVAPAEVAYVCPGWLWAEREESSVSGSFDEYDCNPDAPPCDEIVEGIRGTFLAEVEGVLPGFTNIIRAARARCLRQLYELAGGIMRSTADERKAELVIAAASRLVS